MKKKNVLVVYLLLVSVTVSGSNAFGSVIITDKLKYVKVLLPEIIISFSKLIRKLSCKTAVLISLSKLL